MHPVPVFDDYLDALPPDRADVLRDVIDLVESALPAGYVRQMDFGMPTWVVPLETYPDTYNGHPLGVAALAAQKNYTSLYLQGCYAQPDELETFRADWRASGKKLDMGRAACGSSASTTWRPKPSPRRSAVRPPTS
ncbi:hypothetical protein [Aeromicrobium sp. UC242_57]|uniref:hypothetical protein n=1 Tax=Aeromicrobium sp. UC242_57 TaxID=3374624 RepID=UPI0037A2B3D5